VTHTTHATTNTAIQRPVGTTTHRATHATKSAAQSATKPTADTPTQVPGKHSRRSHSKHGDNRGAREKMIGLHCFSPVTQDSPAARRGPSATFRRYYEPRDRKRPHRLKILDFT
jgi:hypothetical protein